MAKKRFYIYVRRCSDRSSVRSIEVKDANLTQGLLDRLATGLMRQIDMDYFYVDDDEAQKEALRRTTKKGKGR